MGCATPRGWVTPKNLVFLGGLGLTKLPHSTVLIGCPDFWATVCKTVRPMISVRCMSCLSVCNVGVVTGYMRVSFRKQALSRVKILL